MLSTLREHLARLHWQVGYYRGVKTSDVFSDSNDVTKHICTIRELGFFKLYLYNVLLATQQNPLLRKLIALS